MPFSIFSHCYCFGRKQDDEGAFDEVNSQQSLEEINESAQQWTLTSSSCYSYLSSHQGSTSSFISLPPAALRSKIQRRSALRPSRFDFQPCTSKKVHWSASSLDGQTSIEELSATIHNKRLSRRNEQAERKWQRGRQPLKNQTFVKCSPVVDAKMKRSPLISSMSSSRPHYRKEIMYPRFPKSTREASVVQVYEYRCAQRARLPTEFEHPAIPTEGNRRQYQVPPFSPSEKQSEEIRKQTKDVDITSYWSCWESNLNKIMQSELSILLKQKDDFWIGAKEEIEVMQNTSKIQSENCEHLHHHRGGRFQNLITDGEPQENQPNMFVSRAQKKMSKERRGKVQREGQVSSKEVTDLVRQS